MSDDTTKHDWGALTDYVQQQLARATEAKSQSSRTSAMKVLSAVTLAASFGKVPMERKVARAIAAHIKNRDP